jgi:prepilin-type N-terminal cleavage/methylation domain-containing protein
MIIAIRRRMSVHGSQAGITLVELMVAMIVFGILSAIVVSLYTATNKSVLSTSSSDQNTQAAGNVMNELTRVIRGATTNPTSGGGESSALLTATPTVLALYSYVDSSALSPSPFLVQFTINSANGQLVEKRWPASTDSNGIFTFDSTKTPSLTRTFPGKLSAPVLFAYYGLNNVPLGNPVAGSSATLSPTSITKLGSDLDLVVAITVTVTSQSSTNTTIKPATLQNTVGMPNVTLEANN